MVAVYNGFNSHFHLQPKAPEITRKYIDADEYLFFLGNTDPKKNTPRVLKAYSDYLKRSQKKLPLLIADLKEDAIDRILGEEKITDIKGCLRFPGYIANTDLPALYSGAFAFLYPSLRESFGIPMLEAMACGTPVIAGNTSAMPEIAGEGALLADPFSSGGHHGEDSSVGRRCGILPATSGLRSGAQQTVLMEEQCESIARYL